MMSDSLFQEMPIGMRLHYEQAARLDEAASASRKRKADVETLKAFADAMKEHGSTEQYITSQKAISALFKQTISDLGLISVRLNDAPAMERARRVQAITFLRAGWTNWKRKQLAAKSQRAASHCLGKRSGSICGKWMS